MTTLPATEFNRNPSRIKRLAAAGPVVITERNEPTLVVLSYAEYERLVGAPDDLASWLVMDEEIDSDIEPVGLDLIPVGRAALGDVGRGDGVRGNPRRLPLHRT